MDEIKKVASIVLAHDEAQNTVMRHLPIWKEHTDYLLFVCPEDSMCDIPGEEVIGYGNKEHHGFVALYRWIFTFETALKKFDADYYVFHEYDSLMFRRPVERDLFQSNIFDVNPDQQHRWNSNTFTHFPWIFPAKLLKQLVESIEPTPFEEGMSDRWLPCNLDRIEIPTYNLLKSQEGFSSNSIDSQELLEELIRRARNGAYAFHGIKTEEVLSELVKNINYKL